MGATFEVTSDADKQKFGISSGITVKSVTKDGKFAVNGIQPGLIILKANNQTVNSVEDLQQIVAACKKNNGQKYNEQALFISGLYKGKLTYYAVDLN